VLAVVIAAAVIKFGGGKSTPTTEPDSTPAVEHKTEKKPQQKKSP
jgi:hypothetical protein